MVWFDSASMRRRKIYGGSVGGGDFVARNSLSRELLSRSVETRGESSAATIGSKRTPQNFSIQPNVPGHC